MNDKKHFLRESVKTNASKKKKKHVYRTQSPSSASQNVFQEFPHVLNPRQFSFEIQWGKKWIPTLTNRRSNRSKGVFGCFGFVQSLVKSSFPRFASLGGTQPSALPCCASAKERGQQTEERGSMASQKSQKCRAGGKKSRRETNPDVKTHVDLTERETT